MDRDPMIVRQKVFCLDPVIVAVYHNRKEHEGNGMDKVTIIGSGNVGANTAFFIAEKGVADVALYDIQSGIATGKALDIMEAAPIRTYRSKIASSNSWESVERSRVVLVAAGAVRKPGMKREALFDQNVKTIREIARLLGRHVPESSVIIMTEPVDMLTAVFTTVSGMPREKVLGLGCLLDSTRLRYAIARDLGVSVENVSAMVVGQHGEHMIGLARYCSVSGVPVLNLMLPEQFESLMDETRRAGDFIVEMAKRSSAYYAPSAAAAELIDTICRDLKRVLPVSILLDGELGVEGVALSVPAVIGRNGAERLFLPKLATEELDRIQSSAREMKKKIAEGTNE
jgi:malate dehydrogenase